MTKFYLHTTLFLLPLWSFLFLLPIKKRVKFQEIKNDCFNHGIWLHDRIHHNPKPMDMVFLGSFHTINALNDSLIETRLGIENSNVVNLGYCRLGRNLSYILLREILEEKSPKHVFIEVREDEDRYSHPIFPYLSQSRDVMFPPVLFNRDILYDLFDHFSYKLLLFQCKIFKATITKK